VVLLAADGVAGIQIAAQAGLSPQSVCKWRCRFRDHGLEGLSDASRSGRPLVYGPTDRLVLMAKVTEEHPTVDAQWSHSELAVAMKAAAIPISASQIGRILAAGDLEPRLVQGSKQSPVNIRARRSSRVSPSDESSSIAVTGPRR